MCDNYVQPKSRCFANKMKLHHIQTRKGSSTENHDTNSESRIKRLLLDKECEIFL